MASNPDFNDKTTGTEAAKALADHIRGKYGAFSFMQDRAEIHHQAFLYSWGCPPDPRPRFARDLGFENDACTTFSEVGREVWEASKKCTATNDLTSVLL